MAKTDTGFTPLSSHVILWGYIRQATACYTPPVTLLHLDHAFSRVSFLGGASCSLSHAKNINNNNIKWKFLLRHQLLDSVHVITLPVFTCCQGSDCPFPCGRTDKHRFTLTCSLTPDRAKMIQGMSGRNKRVCAFVFSKCCSLSRNICFPTRRLTEKYSE